MTGTTDRDVTGGRKGLKRRRQGKGPLQQLMQNVERGKIMILGLWNKASHNISNGRVCIGKVM